MLKWPERNCVQITCNPSGAYHVQHAVCHVVQKDSSAVMFDIVKIAFILAVFYWLKPLTDKRGVETGVPGETPDVELQKVPHTKTPSVNP